MTCQPSKCAPRDGASCVHVERKEWSVSVSWCRRARFRVFASARRVSSASVCCVRLRAHKRVAEANPCCYLNGSQLRSVQRFLRGWHVHADRQTNKQLDCVFLPFKVVPGLPEALEQWALRQAGRIVVVFTRWHFCIWCSYIMEERPDWTLKSGDIYQLRTSAFFFVSLWPRLWVWGQESAHSDTDRVRSADWPAVGIWCNWATNRLNVGAKAGGEQGQIIKFRFC